ncbi:MAG: histidine phosphatase family protein [Candidatus Thorarchaeota archaeon SMTZ1-45]
MFEYVQEREVSKRVKSRTLVYVITIGESEGFNSQALTDRGENQLIEMARSRVATGVRVLYSATDKIALKSSNILEREFESKIQKVDCLNLVKFGTSMDDLNSLGIRLRQMWKDEEFVPDNGESFIEARERFSSCMGSLVSKHKDDVVAVVVDPLMAILFHSHIVAAPLDISEWHSMGYAACASYEYSRGWSLVMPPDNSYLSDPTTVGETLQNELL